MKNSALTSAVFILAFLAFSFSSTQQKVIVIDVGHGGKDHGASTHGVVEKDITLKIAKKLEELNTNEHYKIVLNRQEDQMLELEERVAFAHDQKADMLLSIHVNYAQNEQKNGIELYHKNDPVSERITKHFATQLRSDFPVRHVGTANFYVFRKSNCPAMMLETGFLSNKADFDRLTSDDEIHALAKAVIKSISLIDEL